MAQRSNLQIDDIKINKRDNAFFMDIDATIDEPNQIRKLNISELVQSNDCCIVDFRHYHFWSEIICRRQGR
nr:MAG TPA: hypothetical protein [Caudoviricetes sp.]